MTARHGLLFILVICCSTSLIAAAPDISVRKEAVRLVTTGKHDEARRRIKGVECDYLDIFAVSLCGIESQLRGSPLSISTGDQLPNPYIVAYYSRKPFERANLLRIKSELSQVREECQTDMLEDLLAFYSYALGDTTALLTRAKAREKAGAQDADFAQLMYSVYALDEYGNRQLELAETGLEHALLVNTNLANDPDVLMQKAIIHYSRSNYVNCLKVLEGIEQRFPVYMSRADDASWLIHLRANSSFFSGDFTNAQANYFILSNWAAQGSSVAKDFLDRNTNRMVSIAGGYASTVPAATNAPSPSQTARIMVLGIMGLITAGSLVLLRRMKQ